MSCARTHWPTSISLLLLFGLLIVLLLWHASQRTLIESKQNNNGTYHVSEIKALKKPALYVRNIAHLMEGESSTGEEEGTERVAALFKNYATSVERVQVARGTTKVDRDKVPNLAVAYFHSEEAALRCLTELHGKNVDGRRISAAYR